MKNLLSYLILPSELTDFERRYLERLNRIAVIFFALHVPVFAAIAWLNGTSPLRAMLLTLAVLLGPVIARATISNPRTVSVVHGIAAMFFGGLLVHFGQGPVQIEMHFYFFALIAMCAVFGNPMVIIAAAVTVALHHLVVWLALPASVFNYQAEWWVVAVHAAFVVLESVAACFIARSFFDNVIGLERIVQSRTKALDAKNRDMRLLLDNVDQGFLTIDRAGSLAAERSAAVERWFGAPSEGATWFEYLKSLSPEFAIRTELGWAEVVEGIMPPELTLEQLPRQLAVGAQQYRFDYRPIGDSAAFERCLIVITDVTSAEERRRSELEKQEAMAVFERVLSDRVGFATFFEEGTNIVDALTSQRVNAPSVVKRLLHTLKGNAALFGIGSVSSVCDDLETHIAEHGSLPTVATYQPLLSRWEHLTRDVNRMLRGHAHGVPVSEQELLALENAARRGESNNNIYKMVRGLRLEPTHKRLSHFADQAQRIAQRLEKGQLRVRIEDHGVKLDPRRWGPFWSAFIHAVRNAVDHGVESPEDRIAGGKSSEGTLVLRTVESADQVLIEIIDDGRGVDWQAVGARAERLGLPTRTRDDLTHALFIDGVSTTEVATDLSGRGVGMGALLDATRALGGDLLIETTTGQGTRLTMSIPTSAVATMAPAAA